MVEACGRTCAVHPSSFCPISSCVSAVLGLEVSTRCSWLTMLDAHPRMDKRKMTWRSTAGEGDTHTHTVKPALQLKGWLELAVTGAC